MMENPPKDKNQPVGKNSFLSGLLIVSGTVFVFIGFIGIFVPVLPTTPFLLLAALCYVRSSRKLYVWLLTNRWLGRYISAYLQKKGVPLVIKCFAISLLWVAIGTSVAFVIDSLVVRIILLVIAVGVTVHLVRIPTLK